MNEIPFKIGSSLKWISGISSETTCKDIMISLLKTEKLFDGPEETVHHHYALVESWREVSKVLPANSLILKIWIAWGEEQQNVAFTVKRIKNPRKGKPDTTAQPVNEENLSKGQKRLKRRNSRNNYDTLHPKAFSKNRHSMSKDIQEQMKKIITQGETIRRHLDQIKNLECEAKNDEAKLKHDHIVDEDLNDSGHVTDVSDSTNEEISVKSNKKDDPASIRDDYTFQKSNDKVSEYIQNQANFSSNTSDDVINNEELFESLEDTESSIDILEQVHRLNRLLESKEEQLLTLNLEMQILTECNLKPNAEASEFSLESSATSCFDNEVKIFRELNAKLLKDISENSSVIENLQDETDNRKKLVTQLEFDVNVIERESKRLQTDLLKIEGIGSDIHDKKSGIKEHNPPIHIMTPLSSNSSDSSQSGSSGKSVKFCEKNIVFSSSSCISPNLLTENSKFMRRSILKGDSDIKFEFGSDGSDASSDTGVSSLSSSEGDYSLSTLV